MKTARIMENLSLTPASMLVTCRLGDHVKLYKITDIQKCTINNEECVVLVIASNTSALTAAEAYHQLNAFSKDSLPVLLRTNSYAKYYKTVGVSFRSFTKDAAQYLTNGVTFYGEKI